MFQKHLEIEDVLKIWIKEESYRIDWYKSRDMVVVQYLFLLHMIGKDLFIYSKK